MTVSNNLFSLDEKINEITISEDLAINIIGFLPLVKSLSEAITQAKFYPSEATKLSYQKALKEFCTFIIEFYPETLSRNRYFDELRAFLVAIRNKSEYERKREKQRLTAHEQVSLICQRNYKHAES